ncbi:hypothetical protein Riv7116_6107 [Rivularia sp. PCC 7116]|uniref:hypothetical protein n=1 Tax=Rivularia sp. PCC 7116 TaxID=373994 RepID=UPI00029EF287|nr:hypothetical protein [Rivularia sp. PCC 7116]AFY58463.1 hypothetical protein Riv7116_6107 [Rivularia sp. PCC 7116]
MTNESYHLNFNKRHCVSEAPLKEARSEAIAESLRLIDFVRNAILWRLSGHEVFCNQ